VQEGLTNAVKHAVGASAAVHVDYAEDALGVEVSDTGGHSGMVVDGGGRGLLGLKERVAMYGGTVEAGPRPSGGYRVRAWIPR